MNDLDVCMMTLDEARRVTERIRIQATNFMEARQKLEATVEEAKTGRAWEVLSYSSWTAYLADALGDEPLRLSRDERKDVVTLLAGEGMSTRAIAPIVGVTRQRVSQIQNEVASDLPPVTSGNTSVSAPSATSPESPIAATAAQVTGMDGKTYTRTWPEPTTEKPRRTPLTRTIESALLDLDRRSTTLLNSLEDDRWDGIKNQVASTRASDLDRIIDRLTTVRQSLK